jgi:hypothetical protein
MMLVERWQPESPKPPGETDDNLACVLDHHEHIQQAERGGDGNQEVAGNDSLGVKMQERRPAQVASGSAWRTSRQLLARGPRR